MSETHITFPKEFPLTRLAVAFGIAEWLHKGQIRKIGEDVTALEIDYLTHLAEVMALTIQGGASEDQRIAALLHDALEDQPTYADEQSTEQLILDTFGKSVLSMVQHCTDTDVVGPEGQKEPWALRKVRHIQHIDAAAAIDRDFLLVTLCDKLSNAQDIVSDAHEHSDAPMNCWGRFNNEGDPRRTSWYYEMMLAVLKKHCKDKANLKVLLSRLERNINELKRLAHEAAEALGKSDPITDLPPTLDETLTTKV